LTIRAHTTGDENSDNIINKFSLLWHFELYNMEKVCWILRGLRFFGTKVNNFTSTVPCLLISN
jgi:hypothetical protein